MDNFKEKRSGGFAPRKGNRERASFNPNFSDDNRLNGGRQRSNKQQSEWRPKNSRVERRDSENGGDFGRYKRTPRFNNDFEGGYQQRTPRRRFGEDNGFKKPFSQNSGERPQRQGGWKSYDTAENSYSAERRTGGYSQRGNRSASYDPNAKYSKKKRIAYREAAIDPDAPLRLNKYLANAGICSRREADNYIEAGLISVNGTIVTELGTKVTHNDDIRFNGERISPERKVYVLLNKPKDCVTTVDDPQERKTVLHCLKGIGKERIYPVGRLDRNTTGVLLLTNDGDMASKLTHPKVMKKKIYHVTCDKNVAMSDMDLLVSGIELEDGPVYADEVTYVNEADRSQIGIEIHSGKNRIVRRMLEHLGYRVNKLDRVLFAGLTKKNLKRGDWRYLTEKEVNMLRMGAYE